MKRRILILLSCLTFALYGQDLSGTSGQQSIIELGIEDALKLALENNVTYKLSQEEVKQARWKVLENNGILPVLTLQGNHMLDQKLMIMEFSFMPGEPPMQIPFKFYLNNEFTFQLVQPVFTGGKIWFNFKNSQIDLAIAKEKQKNSREDTILNVKRAFYTTQILEQLQRAHQEALDLAQNNYQNIKQSYDLGMASQYDLLRAELAVSSVKPELARVENMLQTAIAGMKILIGLPDNQQIVLKGELGFNPFQVEEAKAIQKALANRSEILQLQMETRKIGNLLKMTWAQFFPDLALVARYNYRSDSFNFKPDNWQDYYSIALSLNFTIFSGLKRSAQVGEMQVARKMMGLNQKQLSDATILEVQNKIRTIKQEYENIRLGQKNMESAREGVRIAELSYKEGLITILELNSSYNELTRAKVNYLQALYNYNITIAELEKIAGIKINGGMQ